MFTPYDDDSSKHTSQNTPSCAQLCSSHLDDHSARVQFQSSALSSGHLSVFMMLTLSLTACQTQSPTSDRPPSEASSSSTEQAAIDGEDATNPIATAPITTEPIATKRATLGSTSSATPKTSSAPRSAGGVSSLSSVSSASKASGTSSDVSAPGALSFGRVAADSSGGHADDGGAQALGLQGVGRGGGGAPERRGLSQLGASGSGSTPAAKPQAGATIKAEAPRREAGPTPAEREPEESPAQDQAKMRKGGVAKTSKRRGSPRRRARVRPSRRRPHRYKYRYSDEQLRSIIHGHAVSVNQTPVSTFSMDVDTTSYTRLRSATKHNKLLPANEVKIEGFVNAFPYELDSPPAESDLPLSLTVEVSQAPWKRGVGGDQLLRLSLRARDMTKPAQESTQGSPQETHEESRAPSNLVFLVDVSGSMRSRDKLPLVKRSLERLIKQLKPQDKVSLVTYSGEVKTLLKPTLANRRGKRAMKRAFRRLRASGSTAGGAGLERAYELAVEGFLEEGNNRILVATDGDFNVGISSVAEIKDFISEKRSTGVYLSMLGFGHKNYSDANMGALAKSGNGNYVFIDTLEEADRALRVELEGLLNTVAHDIKLQVEFNPEHVTSYRLLGYRQRRLAAADFTNDQKDSAELGAGQQVTALYELWTPYQTPEPRVKLSYPCGDRRVADNVDCPDRKGDETPPTPDLSVVREWGKLKLRFKRAVDTSSEEVAYPIRGASVQTMKASFDHRAAIALALFAEGQRSIQYPLSTYQYDYSRWGLSESTLTRRESHSARALLKLIKPQRGESMSERQRDALKDLRALIKSTSRVLKRSGG